MIVVTMCNAGSSHDLNTDMAHSFSKDTVKRAAQDEVLQQQDERKKRSKYDEKYFLESPQLLDKHTQKSNYKYIQTNIDLTGVTCMLGVYPDNEW